MKLHIFWRHEANFADNCCHFVQTCHTILADELFAALTDDMLTITGAFAQPMRTWQ